MIINANISFLGCFTMPTAALAAYNLGGLDRVQGSLSFEVVDTFAKNLEGAKDRNALRIEGTLRLMCAGGRGNPILFNTPVFNDLITRTSNLETGGFTAVQFAAAKTLQASADMLIGASTGMDHDGFETALRHLVRDASLGQDAAALVQHGEIILGRVVPFADAARVLSQAGLGDPDIRKFVAALLAGSQDGVYRFPDMAIHETVSRTGDHADAVAEGPNSADRFVVMLDHKSPLDGSATLRKPVFEDAIKDLYGDAGPADGDVLWVSTGTFAAQLTDKHPPRTLGALVLSRQIPERLQSTYRRREPFENRNGRQCLLVPCIYYDGKLVIHSDRVRGPHAHIIIGYLLGSQWPFALDQTQINENRLALGNEARQALIAQAKDAIARAQRVEIPGAIISSANRTIEASMKR